MSPPADPRWRQPHPRLLFSVILYISFRPRAAKWPRSVFPSAGAENALKTRWVRIKRLFVQPVGVTGLSLASPSFLPFLFRRSQRGERPARPFLVGMGAARAGGCRRGKEEFLMLWECERSNSVNSW